MSCFDGDVRTSRRRIGVKYVNGWKGSLEAATISDILYPFGLTGKWYFFIREFWKIMSIGDNQIQRSASTRLVTSCLEMKWGQVAETDCATYRRYLRKRFVFAFVRFCYFLHSLLITKIQSHYYITRYLSFNIFKDTEESIFPFPFYFH